MPATEQIEKEYCQYFDIKIYNIVIVNYIVGNQESTA